MTGLHEQTKALRKFVIDNVDEHSLDIVIYTARHFGISRQAAHKHIQSLVKEGFLKTSGQPPRLTYIRTPLEEYPRGQN